MKLAKLKKLEIDLDEEDMEQMLQTVINNFPTLTHLNLKFYASDENAIYKPLKSISKLKHLIHFKLINEYRISNNRFCGLFEQIDINYRIFNI